ncbi:MAG: TonB-dependent receptor plug domain-containing protein, partial [Janthinobacterium sp.]
MMLSKPKLSPISKAVFFALSAIAASAHAQNTAGTAEPVMQRVEVTGSNIKRMDSETASPVTVMRRDEIKATGANTVRQILDTLTSFDTGAIKDDGNSTSFARGASGASMRGLGTGATLVLVNGRRVSNYPFANGAKDTFVNLDSIPADVIDRVEVLKDGASAIYGSDALAGVINIITRKSFQGVSTSANYQQGLDPNIGKQTTIGVLAGYGDLEKDRYNVFFNVEGYKREGYKLSKVLREYPEWHKKYVSTAFGDPSLTSFPGNLNESSRKVRQAVKGCTTFNASGLCVSDLNGINPVSDGAERINLYS